VLPAEVTPIILDTFLYDITDFCPLLM